MKRRAAIIKFPQRVPIRCGDDDARPRGETAIVIILPVVRIETYAGDAPARSRRGRRKPDNGDAA